MRQNLEQLKRLFDQEVEICKAIIDILSLEKEAVLKFDPKQILDATQKKEGLSLRYEILLKARNGLIDQIYLNHNIQISEINLKQFISELKSPELRDSMLESLDELWSLSEEISQQNQMNRRFVEHSLGYIHQTVHLLRGQGKKKKTYNSLGKLSNGKGVNQGFRY